MALPEALVEQIAEHDFSEETTLIFGATNGFGRKLAVDLRRRGVRRIGLGTTSTQSNHYVNTLTEVREANTDLGGEGIVAVQANLMNQDQVKAALDNLPEVFRPRHVFLLPATGMQFAREFSQYVSRLQGIKNHPDRYEEDAREKVLVELHEQYDIWLPANLEESVRMNLLAPVRTIEALASRFREGFTLTYLDSTFGDEGRGPRYYTNVLTKHAFDIWLAQNGKSYASKGIDTARIVAPAILGTEIGDYLVDEIAEVEDSEVADLLIQTAVDPEDIFIPIYEFLLMSREERAADGLPFTRFVTRYEDISGDNRLWVGHDIPEDMYLQINPDKYQL